MKFEHRVREILFNIQARFHLYLSFTLTILSHLHPFELYDYGDILTYLFR